MLPPTRQYITVEEYLWEEQHAETKHNYYNGQVYNMAGGSPEHSLIAVNLTSELRVQLRGRGCQVFSSDLKVAVPGQTRAKGKKRQRDEEFVSYPDASVVCGQLEFYKEDRQTLANPLILVEVLSRATRNYDRSTKLEEYRKLPSLMSYIMIDSEKVWEEQYSRTGQKSWQVEAALEDLEATLEIKALDLSIPLALLYEGVKFEDED